MRRKLDAYYTPEWMTRCLLRHVPSIRGDVVEPCVGDGAISHVLRQYVDIDQIVTNDIDELVKADHWYDATEPGLWSRVDGCSWVVTNPPFSMRPKPLPVAILQHAYRTVSAGVALLLRISFLEPCENRGQWLQDHPPSKLIIMPRYSFKQNGKSDSATTAWMVWCKHDLAGPPIIVDADAETRVYQQRQIA